MKEAVKQGKRIGSLAKDLGVEQFVIRFWEKEFGICAKRTKGGQRFYHKQDIEKFKQIKKLLYEEGFTIAGAKKCLTPEVVLGEALSHTSSTQECTQFCENLKRLRAQLLLLHKILQ